MFVLLELSTSAFVIALFCVSLSHPLHCNLILGCYLFHLTDSKYYFYTICHFRFPPSTDSVVESPQLSPFNSKGPLCLSPSFQMSTLSLPGQASSPLQSPILSEVGGNARLEEEEEGRRKVHCLHATLPPPRLTNPFKSSNHVTHRHRPT